MPSTSTAYNESAVEVSPDGPPKPIKGTRHRPWWAPVAIGVTTLLLSVRLLRFIDRYAVNVFFLDEWDFWTGMFDHDSWLKLFFWQHGPHRQGLGDVVLRLTAEWSRWDTKDEALVMGTLFIVSALVALAIQRLMAGRWSLFDVCVPLIVLTLLDYETFVNTPNPAHGTVPLLLVLLIALVRFVPSIPTRVGLTVVLNFLVVFTGFGLFFGVVAGLVFAVDLVAAVRSRERWGLHAAGLAAAVGTLLLFFRHYTFSPAVSCFKFPDPHPTGYLIYLVTIYLRPFQLHDVGAWRWIAAPVILLGNASVLAWSGWSMIRSGGKAPRAVVLFSLSAFPLLFALNCAVGRVCLGAYASAMSSRYVPYLLPAMLALYGALQIAPIGPRTRKAALLLFLGLCVLKEVRMPLNMRDVHWLSDGKARWAACYRRLEDAARCDKEARFKIYPDPSATHLGAKLAYLKAHRLNLFKDAN